MNRRTLLSSIFGASAALALDPEKALWTPGKKLISIPKRQLPFTTYGISGSWQGGTWEGGIVLSLDWEAPIGSRIAISTADDSNLPNPITFITGTGTRQKTEVALPPSARSRVRVRLDIEAEKYNPRITLETLRMMNARSHPHERYLTALGAKFHENWPK